MPGNTCEIALLSPPPPVLKAALKRRGPAGTGRGPHTPPPHPAHTHTSLCRPSTAHTRPNNLESFLSLNVIFSSQSLQINLQMKFAHSGYYRLSCVLVAFQLKSRIFARKSPQSFCKCWQFVEILSFRKHKQREVLTRRKKYELIDIWFCGKKK